MLTTVEKRGWAAGPDDDFLGAIVGNVTAPTGAAVRGAKVIVTNKQRQRYWDEDIIEPEVKISPAGTIRAPETPSLGYTFAERESRSGRFVTGTGLREHRLSSLSPVSLTV